MFDSSNQVLAEVSCVEMLNIAFLISLLNKNITRNRQRFQNLGNSHVEICWCMKLLGFYRIWSC